MMTSSKQSDSIGRCGPGWNMPTMLDLDSSSAEARTEQWLDLVEWTPASRRCQEFPPTEPAEALESVRTETTVSLPAERVDSNEPLTPRLSPEPTVSSGPDLERSTDEPSVAASGPGEHAVMVTSDTSLADLQSLALQPWPANRSIEPYLSRVEALQLALVIARLESTQGDVLRRREQRRLRRTVGLVAVGSAVSMLVLALASQFDLSAPAERVEPAPVVTQERVVSPIGASVRFSPEPVAVVPTPATETVRLQAPKARAVVRKPAHRK